MKFYKFLVLLVLAFILVSGCTQIKPTDGRQEPVYTEGTLPQTADVKTITVKVVDGANVLVEQPIELPNDSSVSALDVTVLVAGAEVQQYEFGVFVSSVAGKAADTEHYWALYINGEYASKGADQYPITEVNSIEWRYEAVEEFPLE